MDDKEIRLRIMEALIPRASTAELQKDNIKAFLEKVEEMAQYATQGQTGQPSTRRRRGKAQDKP